MPSKPIPILGIAGGLERESYDRYALRDAAGMTPMGTDDW